MEKIKDNVLCDVTQKYLSGLDLDNLPNPKEIKEEILNDVKLEFELENLHKAKGQEWKILESLSFSQIADIMIAIYPICKVACAGESASVEYDLLAIYEKSGKNEGIYVTDTTVFRKIAKQFYYNLTNNEFNEIMATMMHEVERQVRCSDKDLIAVNNGIFNYKTKELLPFSPNYVFLTKSRVNYNPNATNTVIHNDDDNTDWDVESWMQSLSDDPEIVNVLWEIMGATIRPNVRWQKSAWLYSTLGNNGKGTLCELLRNIVGHGSYASIKISDLSEDFLLEPLIRSSAIIVDENDVGVYIDKAANLKAIVTNDVIQINRKFKTPMSYQFFGFMIQCLNEYPRIKDKTDSFYRRQLFIPMTKCFTGRERKYIKDDYLHHTEVLEYVLHRLLHMDYYTLSEPQACIDALAEYKGANDPIRQFLDEMLPLCEWDLLPYDFLYELYKAWFKNSLPSGIVQNKTPFTDNLKRIVLSDYSNQWDIPENAARSKNRMDRPEPLIVQYEIKKWENPNYNGPDLTKLCMPALSEKYRGLVRK